jgi:hypothetical protein
MKTKGLWWMLGVLWLVLCFIYPGLITSEPIHHEDTSFETLVKIEIVPAQVFLGGQRNTQQLVVEGHHADGFSEDLTSRLPFRQSGNH